ncbi:LysM-like peptidoglycan-binding domain-containing protein [Providencia sp. PROV152]|uniref:Cell envelope opacity-associated protein A n=1 Tax=Providencia stuartii TaxID=588 RepID=A0AAI9HXF0_PROST|nr:LysM-like peptidoglycan-binding domain-containing protein [Providencia sp. PROV152]ELR5034335.1 cell envelope opacity-associated protein A [Providencia stuartii]
MLKFSRFHRIGITILAIIVIAALFWPTGDENQGNKTPQSQPQPIVVPPPTTPEIVTPTPSEEPIDNGQTEGALAGVPAEPEIIQEPPVEQTPPEVTSPPATTTPPKQTQQPATRPTTNEWQNYQIQKGKTLAQLFRDNHLQANDAFVMARVEGAEKPLSSLRQGQKIRLKANAKGEVQLLEITTAEGKTFSFARLSDGSYYRTP